MSQELHYTSAPSGLKPGAKGFCTVAMTAGLSPQWVDHLELLSGYRFAFEPSSSQAHLNPVAFAHWRSTIAGKARSVLSRVSNAGLDYTGRSNKYAHHLVLEPNEMTPAGPAWLLRQRGLLDESWSGAPRHLPTGRAIPSGNRAAVRCDLWAQCAGDAGWAGALADAIMRDEARPSYIIYAPQTDVLALIDEAIALLPPAERWRVTFSTYFTDLPAGMTCAWRAVLAETPAARDALRQAGRSLVINLTAPAALPATHSNSPNVQLARTGEPAATAISEPTLPTSPTRLIVNPQPTAVADGDTAQTLEAPDSAMPIEARRSLGGPKRLSTSGQPQDGLEFASVERDSWMPPRVATVIEREGSSVVVSAPKWPWIVGLVAAAVLVAAGIALMVISSVSKSMPPTDVAASIPGASAGSTTGGLQEELQRQREIERRKQEQEEAARLAQEKMDREELEKARAKLEARNAEEKKRKQAEQEHAAAQARANEQAAKPKKIIDASNWNFAYNPDAAVVPIKLNDLMDSPKEWSVHVGKEEKKANRVEIIVEAVHPLKSAIIRLEVDPSRLTMTLHADRGGDASSGVSQVRKHGVISITNGGELALKWDATDPVGGKPAVERAVADRNLLIAVLKTAQIKVNGKHKSAPCEQYIRLASPTFSHARRRSGTEFDLDVPECAYDISASVIADAPIRIVNGEWKYVNEVRGMESVLLLDDGSGKTQLLTFEHAIATTAVKVKATLDQQHVEANLEQRKEDGKRWHKQVVDATDKDTRLQEQLRMQGVHNKRMSELMGQHVNSKATRMKRESEEELKDIASYWKFERNPSWSDTDWGHALEKYIQDQHGKLEESQKSAAEKTRDLKAKQQECSDQLKSLELLRKRNEFIELELSIGKGPQRVVLRRITLAIDAD